MIASLRGILRHKDAHGAIIECAGVGYGVAMSLAALSKLGNEGDEVFVLVHTHLSQDALKLYAFLDAEEQATFAVLIGTSGVGPRLALAILSTLAPRELAAVIEQGDKGMLVKIPGVGGKKAERLLVELKDRLPKVMGPAPGAASAPAGDLAANLASALVNLGFAPTVAEAAARRVLEEHPRDTSLPELVRQALRAASA